MTHSQQDCLADFLNTFSKWKALVVARIHQLPRRVTNFALLPVFEDVCYRFCQDRQCIHRASYRGQGRSLRELHPSQCLHPTHPTSSQRRIYAALQQLPCTKPEPFHRYSTGICIRCASIADPIHPRHRRARSMPFSFLIYYSYAPLLPLHAHPVQESRQITSNGGRRAMVQMGIDLSTSLSFSRKDSSMKKPCMPVAGEKAL